MRQFCLPTNLKTVVPLAVYTKFKSFSILWEFTHALDQLLATLNTSIASVERMVQNADASDKKDGVKNEDKKDEKIENLTAKIANLEERLKNAEHKDEDVKNAEGKAVKNFVQRIANLLKNADEEEESVTNKKVRNTEDEKDKVQNSDEKDDEQVVNLARKIVNLLRNACSDKKDEVQNSDEDESVKNKGLKNRGVRNTDEDEEKNIENLLTRISNLEAKLKNADEEEESVKNKKVRNTEDEKDKVQNTDDEEKSVKNKAVTNALTDILGDLVTARQKTLSDLMDVIVTNSGGMYSKGELAGKSLEELQKLSNLLSKINVPVTNASQTNIQMNGAVLNEDAALDIPSTFPAQR